MQQFACCPVKSFWIVAAKAVAISKWLTKDGKSDVEDELPGQFMNVRFFFGNQVIQQYP